MGWLDCSLSNGMRHQEEIEGSIDDIFLLNKALINVGTLWWVVNLVHSLLEESLSNTLVDDDQGMLWMFLIFAILSLDNLVELLKFVANDLGSH